MLKQLFILSLLTLLISGCSNEIVNHEKVVELERDIERINKLLEENEIELKELYQQLRETNEREYIKIPKDEAPKLWSNPEIQLWEYVRDSSFAEENGWNSGTTNWRSWDGEFDQSLSTPNQNWQTPGILMTAWMTDVEFSYWLGQEVWEINTRIEFSDENNAKGYILSYGLFDDAIVGSDVKLIMRKDNGYWYIESVEKRELCSRGVNEDNELCV